MPIVPMAAGSHHIGPAATLTAQRNARLSRWTAGPDAAYREEPLGACVGGRQLVSPSAAGPAQESVERTD